MHVDPLYNEYKQSSIGDGDMARPIEEEYKMLREEIMECMKNQNELSTFVSTTICAFIGVVIALDHPNPFLYLIPFVILLPASFKEANYQRRVAYLASYMIVFLENKDNFLWETRYHHFSSINPTRGQKLRAMLETFEFPLFGILCFILFLFQNPFSFLNSHTFLQNTFPWLRIVSIILMIVLPLICIAIIAWNVFDYHNFRMRIRKEIIVWRQYKRREQKHE